GGRKGRRTRGRCRREREGEAEPESTPELDTPLSLAAARELAMRALRQAKAGSDPAATKRKAREAERAAEADTLQAVAEEYLRREGPRLRTLKQRRSDLELLFQPLGRQPIDQIRRGQYTRVLDGIADQRGPVRADRVLSALKHMLTWHAERSEFVSPLGRGGRRTSIRERARKRILSDAEFTAVWIAAEKDPGPFGPYVRFTVLTATRRSEAAGLHRSELSDNGTTWVIPGSRYKNKLDTLIPLSRAAQKILAGRPELNGGVVFSAGGTEALRALRARQRALPQGRRVTRRGPHPL